VYTHPINFRRLPWKLTAAAFGDCLERWGFTGQELKLKPQQSIIEFSPRTEARLEITEPTDYHLDFPNNVVAQFALGIGLVRVMAMYSFPMALSPELRGVSSSGIAGAVEYLSHLRDLQDFGTAAFEHLSRGTTTLLGSPTTATLRSRDHSAIEADCDACLAAWKWSAPYLHLSSKPAEQVTSTASLGLYLQASGLVFAVYDSGLPAPAISPWTEECFVIGELAKIECKRRSKTAAPVAPVQNRGTPCRRPETGQIRREFPQTDLTSTFRRHGGVQRHGAMGRHPPPCAAGRRQQAPDPA
jgi:hypothetical protein